MRRKMTEPTQIDLAPFLAAAIEEAGGVIRIPYDAFRNVSGAIAFDLEDDGATIAMSITEEIPVED
jgi:hypothetical protein